MIYQLIMTLTQNEDLRQDLWVYYLSNQIYSTFSDKLTQLSLISRIEKSILNNTQDILSLEIPQHDLDQLSDLQRSILLLSILGYNLEHIGKYNDVKQVIIDKEMVDLVQHPLWIRYGIKKEFKPR